MGTITSIFKSAWLKGDLWKQMTSSQWWHISKPLKFFNKYKTRFPFKRNRLRCVNENRKKRKRLRWQAANRGYHCFDRAFLLAGACVCCVKICVSCGFRLRNARNASDCVWMETGLKNHTLLQGRRRRSSAPFSLNIECRLHSHFR